jgi:uncharacterized protein (DUF2147 family)
MRHQAFAAAMGIAAVAFLAPGSQSLAASADPTGYWMKPDAERESKILVFKCGAGKKLLCAKIAWLKDPNDSKGQPLHDVRNENPAMRGRSIVGLTIFSGMTPSAPSTWTGKIYNPEDGHTYSATLTVVSRRQITLRGCKAWLLCGERQWLRTAAPEEPKAPAEGTEQIEASAEPPSAPPAPEAKPSVVATSASEAASTAAAAQAETQFDPDMVAQPVSLVSTAAQPVPAQFNARKGYGFLNVSTAPDDAAHYSGENVSSMFDMTKPIAAETAPPASSEEDLTAAVQSQEAVPAPKPKAKPKPIATADAKPAPKPAPKAATQAAPAPQDEAAQADAADVPPGETAEAAMVEPVPLTRRQRRMLRKQQQGDHDQAPLLPWLR